MDPFINMSAQFPNGAVPNPQFALLNYFFPGFSMFTSALHTYLGIDLNFYIPLLVAIFGLNFVWSYFSTSAWAWIDEYLMSSFRVRTDDEIYNMLMLWISRQKFSQNSRRFLVNTDLYSRSSYVWGGSNDDSDDEDGDEEVSVDILGPKQTLHYTPSFGSHLFWYKGWPLFFERHQNQQQINFQSASEREELSISCFGRNPRLLKELLFEARQMYLKKDERKTLIYRSSSGTAYGGEPYWQRSMSRPNRPFSTVILSEKMKQDLIDDAADYLNPATRRWYANRGIPYRRGYLLYGPPGTGKSSLSLALAGYFRMKIYIVSLSSINATEEGLTSLFSNLPTRCLVLLEDIDTAGLTHTREEPDAMPAPVAAPNPSAPTPPSGSNTGSGGRLSLSGLLNILDGVASQEGRLLVMTTNHIEKLDKALIRPGRVDMIVPFSLADKTMTESIFRAIYAPFESEISSNELALGSKSGTSTPKRIEPDEEAKQRWARQHAEISERIEVLSLQFATKIPEFEFSPAEIQGLLLKYKRSPEDAIEAADAWVIQTRKDKKEKELQEAEKRRKEQEEEEKKKKAEEEDKKKESEDSTAKTEGSDQKESAEAKSADAPKEPQSTGEGDADKGSEAKAETLEVAKDDKKNTASDSEYERV
ncbi:mitochondrial chaperone BCS1 [Trichoderma harzianum]|uniref:Mitochondrial chaperone BCS1 n=1 Tax=Trichoderma harzianum TaxID=5544 RepID=A0A0F9ZV94_TRIHA|nr:mitochondrial chaperone BCS1 [Trichoderma harzianum]